MLIFASPYLSFPLLPAEYTVNTIRNYGNNITRFTAAELRLLQVSKYTDYPEKESALVEQRFLQVAKRYSLGRSARAGVKVDLGSNEGLP
jgi:hypothetical protein